MNPAISVITPLVLPVIFPYVGDAMAYVLKQDHFARWANDGIAWCVLIAASIVAALVEGQINPPVSVSGHTINWFLASLQVVDGVATLLLAGPLVKLAPWVDGMSWVQAHLFSLSPSTIGHTAEPVSSVTVYNTAASSISNQSGAGGGGGNLGGAGWRGGGLNYSGYGQPLKPPKPMQMPDAPPKTTLPPNLPTENLGG